MTHTYKRMTSDDVEKLNKAATAEDFKILATSGSIIVDARSLLALALLVGKETTLVASDSANPEDFSKFVKRLNS